VAWLLNLYTGIIATVPREMVTSTFDLLHDGCLWIGAINLVPRSMGVVAPQIVHFVGGFIKHLPQVLAEGCPPLAKSHTPARVVRTHQQVL
jgi:hypothetical protein